jgi:hypothetical protein
MDWLGGDHMGTSTDARNNGGSLFSVMHHPCSIYISEPNSEARSSRSREEDLQRFRRVKRMGIQRHTKDQNRMRVHLWVGGSHEKFVVEEELEVGL